MAGCTWQATAVPWCAWEYPKDSLAVRVQVSGFGFRVYLGLMVSGLELRVWGVEFRV